MGDQAKDFKYGSLLVFLVINIFFFKHATSEVYTVGGSDGWNSDAYNYDAWARKHNFSVGDILEFNYVKDDHNVYEVVAATYRSCNTSSGVIAKYDSGNDQLELKQAKKYWFICNVAGHCLGGMRFGIEVKEANNTSVARAVPPTIEPTPPGNSCTKSYVYGRWSLLVSFLFLAFYSN